MPNVIQPEVDGPLKVTGDIEIVAAGGALLKHATEAWLCRCGRSQDKPFCDGSHRQSAFHDPARVGAYQPKAPDPGAPGVRLRITVKANGPLRCSGDMRICDAQGAAEWIGAQASLCRCGASKNKPFCDGSHRETGFIAE